MKRLNLLWQLFILEIQKLRTNILVIEILCYRSSSWESNTDIYTPPRVNQTALLGYKLVISSHLVVYGKGGSGRSFSKEHYSFVRVPHSLPKHLPEDPPPTGIISGIRTSTYEYWVDINIQTTALFCTIQETEICRK